MSISLTKRNENNEYAGSEWARKRSLATRILATRNLFSQEFPMCLGHTKRDENL